MKTNIVTLFLTTSIVLWGCHNETRRNSSDNSESSNIKEFSSNIKEYFNNEGSKIAVYTDEFNGRYLLDGVYKRTTPSGEIVVESYTNGVLNGDRTVYGKDEKKKIYQKYEDGILVSEQDFNENGKIILEVIAKGLKDKRNEISYDIVKIGNKTWMNEPLKFTRKNLDCLDCFDCFKNDESGEEKVGCPDHNTDANIGVRYTWPAAIDYTSANANEFSTNDKETAKNCGYNKECNTEIYIQGICPEGWRIPNASDLEDMQKFINTYPKLSRISIGNGLFSWITDQADADAAGIFSLKDSKIVIKPFSKLEYSLVHCIQD